jgi:hypothetical protein
MLLPWSCDVGFSGEKAMQLRRTLCAAGLLCGLGLLATSVSGGCGGSPPEMRGELSEELKTRGAAHGKAMQEFYAAKKANPGGGKKGGMGRPR